MQRFTVEPRADWKQTAEKYGFNFHTIDGQPYWDETAYYAFSLAQIERDIEGPTREIHEMAMDLAGEVVRSEALMERLAIPRHYWDWIADSWRRGQPHLYGRIDLAYDGTGPAKLFELNYDTPTSLYEAAFYQWLWLEQQVERGVLPKQSDQYNSIQEKLCEALATIAKSLPRPFYFSAARESAEDWGTVQYLSDCAHQVGIDVGLIAVEDIGLSTTGTFTDLDSIVIGTLFKLYPLEMMFEDDYGKYLPSSGIQLIEPGWKAVLSNKGVLPLLWERHPGHPNLLPAYFEDSPVTLRPGWVRKPMLSREGANIELLASDGTLVRTDGPYLDGTRILQAFHPLPRFEGGYPLIGSWVIGDLPAGMGIREDRSLITQDTSRFVPHAIVD